MAILTALSQAFADAFARPKKVNKKNGNGKIDFDGREVLFVTHESPDTDAYVSIFLIVQKVLPKDCKWEIRTVHAGTRLSEEQGAGYIVFHMDTGLKFEPPYDFDQHALPSKTRTSSAQLVADYFKLTKDAGVRALANFATQTDHIEKMVPDSIHHLISGYQFNPLYRDETGEPLWNYIGSQSLEAVKAMYDRTNFLVGSKVRYRRFCKKNPKECMSTLFPSRVQLFSAPGKPGLRNEAWENGADVVLWSQIPNPEKPEQFWVGISTGRDSDVSLRPVFEELLLAEARKRGIKITRDLKKKISNAADLPGGKLMELPTWFCFSADKKRFPLILAGSRAHPIVDDELFTALTFAEIKDIVINTLAGKRAFRKQKVEHLPAPKATPDEILYEEAAKEDASKAA
ncbi:hypothetical protein H7X87_02415 [Acetobacteraceae bacterium]|nr:hypothetical protein [Candidatus Parcubacteria bacterium]